ncbi:MAG: phosphocholine cytidylyltransferase family protein [Deltaproteobacteria bacterium]|nr:phosphocholine cytidylyltransferase family protein [Deltaproteobacteria bacterium]MBW2394961.1 phosphocholine cytidylyltransferase family protein [Deltaproteobacteria bacterium]
MGFKSGAFSGNAGTDVEPRITAACLLAAGTGSRLRPLTESTPKCLTEIGGQSLLERLVGCLRDQGFKRLVVVVGHLEHQIRSFLDSRAGDLVVEYVRNPLYRTTNNIYSLWLAGAKLDESFLLVESDLIFDASLIEGLLVPDRIAVSRMLPWMNGTTIAMDRTGRVASFSNGRALCSGGDEFKTVNIYSLSRSTWRRVLPCLENAISDGRVNDYYEAVFAEMVADGKLSFDCVVFDRDRWYEVDTMDDLPGAERVADRKWLASILAPSLQLAAKGTSA